MDRIEFKADFTVADTGEIEGLAWPFGSADRVGDVIEPGAFAKAHGPIPMMAFHDQKETVGVWDQVNETAKGLVVKGRLLIADVPRAREILALVKEKALPALSIGFATKKSAPRNGGGRTISALDLLEVSIVAVGAHPGALITSAKAAEAGKDATMAENEQGAAPEIAALEGKISTLAETVKGLPDLSKLENRLKDLETKANRPAGEGQTEPTEERKAFGSYLRHGNAAPVESLKALTVSSDPNGGYLAPAEMSAEFIRDLIEVSPVRSVASVRSTGAPSVIYPKRTGITNAKWKGEGQAQEASAPAFGQAEIVVREVNTYVDISNQLLADSAGQAEAEVRLALAEDFGQKEGEAFVDGDGVLEPEGFMTNADIAYTANGHATNLSADALIGLMYALPATYRANGTWGLNGSTLATIRKLKDGQNNYLWQPSYQAGQPETILGRPVIEMPDMPDLASDAFPIIFGDFSGYRIIDRIGLSILVNPYLLATTGFTRIHATRRVGGGVIQAARFRKLKMATS